MSPSRRKKQATEPDEWNEWTTVGHVSQSKDDWGEQLNHQSQQSAGEWYARPDRHVAKSALRDQYPSLLNWTSEDEGSSKVVQLKSPYLRGLQLGHGGSSLVYKVLKEDDGKLFAGKVVQDTSLIFKLRQEAKLLKKLTHKHLMKYEGWYEDEAGNEKTTILLIELCAGGDLNTYLNMRPAMKANEISLVTMQISSALNWLHNHNMYHSDVKPRNILIRSEKPFDVVLGDCADAKQTNSRGKLTGTLAYYSPQMHSTKRNQGPPDDMWALGVSLLNMSCQIPQYNFQRKGRKAVVIVEIYPKQCSDHAAKLKELNPNNELVSLMEATLRWEIGNRICAAEVEKRTKRLVEMGDQGALKIVTPEEFRPIEFW